MLHAGRERASGQGTSPLPARTHPRSVPPARPPKAGVASPTRKPRKSANWSGTPKSVSVTDPLASTAALRLKRSAHESRKRARCARDRIAGSERLCPGDPCRCFTSMCCCRPSCMQARRCSLRLQSCQRSGAEPTGSGCNSTLTWRGLAVALPFHWHCARSGQGRQLRRLAPYTTRKLPSASRRCSCGSSFWLAGHRSVPSGWRRKSWPEKWPAFQGKPTCGGA